MVFKPSSSNILHKHIDYYWIVRDSYDLFSNQSCLNAYPGITPDLILVLDGHFNFNYLGQNYGQVTSVGQDKIELIEVVPDGLGAWVQRPASLAVAE